MAGDPTGADAPVSRFWTSQGLRLHYLDWGNAGAPTLLLLHGGADHARSLDRIAAALRHEWHVVAPDMRGHGDSAWSPDGDYTLPTLAYDLAELIARLGPLAIVAHSLGGAVALRHAAVFPETVTQIVSIEGLGASPTLLAERSAEPMVSHWRTWTERRRTLIARPLRPIATIEEAEARVRARNPQFPDDLLRHLTLHAVRPEDGDGFRWKRDPLVVSRMPIDILGNDEPHFWASVACPTLLVYGADSWASNPAEDGRARHFRNARVVLIPAAGHWLHHDQHALFMAELRGFLDPARAAPA